MKTKIKVGDMVVRDQKAYEGRYEEALDECDGNKFQASKVMDWDAGACLSKERKYEVLWVHPTDNLLVLANFTMLVPIHHVKLVK